MPTRVDAILARTAGKAKAARARGLVGVWRTLAEQHDEVTALLRRLRANPELQPELWPALRRELLAHERAELREVYPVLRGHERTHALADHHDEEVTRIEQLVEDLDAASSDDWDATFDRLVEAVVRHVEEEELVTFPTALAVLGDKQAHDLDVRVRAAVRKFEEVV
ncbi:MAG: hemerythrin domain-containing protein [Deltaproteobacteria bacterium]|nr:hemerythrin domain-containing protein [Deltaproteobacteria bacterium]